MDEIILNPKSLQTSTLNLTLSSQVISVGGGTMCLHSSFVQVFAQEAQEWTIQVILRCGSFVHLHQSRNPLRVSSFRVHHLKTNIWLKENPQGQKKRKKKPLKKTASVLFSWRISWSFFFFFYKQYCLFMLLSFQPSHWYPPSLIYPLCTVKYTDTLPVRVDSGRNFDLKMTSLLGLTNVI